MKENNGVKVDVVEGRLFIIIICLLYISIGTVGIFRGIAAWVAIWMFFSNFFGLIHGWGGQGSVTLFKLKEPDSEGGVQNEKE